MRSSWIEARLKFGRSLLANLQADRAFWFVYFVAFLVALRMGLAIPVMPRLLQAVLGTGPAEVASLYGALISGAAIVAFVSSPLTGWLSDKFGRRLVLLLSLGFSIPAYLAFGFATKLSTIVIAQLFASVAGGSIIAARAYLASKTTPDQRARCFSRFNAAFTLGLIGGPGLGGMLVQYSIRAPFWFAAGLTLAGFVFGATVFPRDIPAQAKANFNWQRLNPFRAFRWKDGGSVTLRGLLMASVLDEFATVIFNAVLALYLQLQFVWDAKDVGRALTIFSASVFLTQSFIAAPLIRKLGEWPSIIVGNLIIASLLMVFGIANAGWQIYLLMALIPLGTMAAPAFQATLSKQVSNEEQGNLQGTIGSLMALVATIGPSVGAWIFAHTSNSQGHIHAPGAVFFVGAFLSFASLAFSIFAYHAVSLMGRSAPKLEAGE